MSKKILTKTEINQIIDLREHGKSLPEIRRITGRASGTVFKYIRGVKILPEFRELWESRRKPSIFRKIKEEQRAEEHATTLIKNIGKHELVLIMACLYWGEGTKQDLSLSNTDPRLVKVFVRCLESLGIQKNDLRVTLRAYEDLDIPRIIEFWSTLLGITQDQILNVNILKGKKMGKLRYGMCRIRIKKGGYILKLISSLIKLISDKIESPHSSMDRTRDS